MDEREKILDLIIAAKRYDPEEKPFSEHLADYLVENGVSIRPAVPGPVMSNDMAERCYRNGEEAMREKVIDCLRDQKGISMGVIRGTISDIIEKVRKL